MKRCAHGATLRVRVLLLCCKLKTLALYCIGPLGKQA